MLSAYLIVESRCATTKVVLPAAKTFKAFCIRISVSVSILAVASSYIKIAGFLNKILAKDINCFSPVDKLLPKYSNLV